MKTTKKRILSILVAVMMLISLLPTTAIAVGTECEHDWGEWTFNKDGTHTRVCKTDSTHIENGNCAELEWTYDSNSHSGRWLCDVCSGGLDKNSADYPEHIYSGDTDLTCDTCGYVRSVEGSLSITGDLPAATVGVAYSASLSYTGEVSGVVFWNATGLPAGLTVDYGTGTISGTPTTAGTYEVTVSMGATGGGSAEKSFTLTVNAEHTHVWSDDWSYNDGYHWHNCTAEGCDLPAHLGEGKDGFAHHEFDIADSSHHSFSPVDVIHFGTCVICGKTDSQILHVTTLQKDDTHHWYECPCGVIGWNGDQEKAEHSFDNDADMICDDCGYDRTPKSPASVTKAPEAITGLKFQEANGKEVEQILITAGEASGGTMVYRLSTDDEWSESIPVAGQARTHSVYYKVLGDSNHNDTEESFVAVTIAKADAPIVTIPAQKHFYTILTTGNRIDIKALLPKLCAIINEESEVTGTTGDFITNAVLDNGILTYDTVAASSPETGTITVKIVMRNYEDVTVTVNVELIEFNPVSNSGTNAEITYNGSTYDVAQMFTKDTNAGEVSYEIIGGSGIGELNGSVLTITKAGTIDIKMTTAANGNYAAGEVTATLTVNKADGAGTVSMDGWTYGENAKTPTTENETGTAIFLYTGSGYSSANVPTDAGTYTVTVTFVENDLYKAATATDTFVIAQKELTPAITGSVSKTYDGTTDVPADHNLSVELAGIITSDDVSATATYAYASADIGTTKIVATITLNGSDAKNYKVATTASADVGEILPAPHVHSYGTEWKSDGNNHWHECSCGAKADNAAHSGGTATCTEKAICTACGQPYGEVLGHDWGNWISNGDGTHTRTCANDANHTETNDCSGGTATCTEKAKCEVCDTAYGNLAQHTYGTEWKSDGNNHWHECSCGAKSGEAAHSGGTATCTEKAICTACGQPYGEVLGHTYGTEWESDGTNHWRECSCGTKTEEAAHSGGTATCTEKAICTTCDQPYGEVLGHTYGTEWKSDGTNHWHECTCGAKAEEAAHTYGNWKVVKKATTTAKGKEERTCSACGHVESRDIPMISDVPQTGDESNLLMWGALMGISVLGMVVLLAESKKRRSVK